MAILMEAKLGLAEGALFDAGKSITLAREELSKIFFLAYEVQIRGLETALAMKLGDFALTDQLVRRNIKWLHLRKLSLSKCSWIHYYNMIGAIVRYKMTREVIRPSLLRHFMNDFRLENPEFYILLEPEIAKATPKNRERHSGKRAKS